MTLRLLFNIIIFLSIFLFNWWLLLIIAVIGIFLFKEFYEGLIYVFIFDSIYSLESPDHFYLKFLTSTIFILILVLIERSKKYIKFYPENV